MPDEEAQWINLRIPADWCGRVIYDDDDLHICDKEPGHHDAKWPHAQHECSHGGTCCFTWLDGKEDLPVVVVMDGIVLRDGQPIGRTK